MDSSPDLSPFLLDLDLDLGCKDSDLDLDLKAMDLDLDLDSDLKVLTASPFFKSFVSTKYRSIRELVLGKMHQCVGASKPTCVSVSVVHLLAVRQTLPTSFTSTAAPVPRDNYL